MKPKVPVFFFVFCCAAVALTVAPSSSTADVVTGYATGVYHNRGEWDNPIILAREFACRLDDAELDEANDCALDWCQDWAERQQGTNPTTRCIQERLADAISKGDASQHDGSSTQTYDHRREE